MAGSLFLEPDLSVQTEHAAVLQAPSLVRPHYSSQQLTSMHWYASAASEPGCCHAACEADNLPAYLY